MAFRNRKAPCNTPLNYFKLAAMVHVALTIAGSDPSGGAGIQADLKTFHRHGCYGCAVISLITVQNTRCVKRVEVLSAQLVGEQLDAVLEDIRPGAVKTGALGSAEVVEAVADRFTREQLPLVVDPVIFSKHGAALASDRAREQIEKRLLPHALLVTPNLHEAESFARRPISDLTDVREAARAIADLGPRGVLIKGGHGPVEALDTLYFEGQFHIFRGPKIESIHTHGVGCTLSAAITAQLSQGRALLDAIGRAKAWLTSAIATAPGVGQGIGAVNHHAPLIDDTICPLGTRG
jgi:hydroxymethylpyrimidine/phosphomethylpyrimidine kinase